MPRARRRVSRRLRWAAGLSLLVHVLLVVAVILRWPPTPPVDVAPDSSVAVVFEAAPAPSTTPDAPPDSQGPPPPAPDAPEQAPGAPPPTQPAPPPTPEPAPEADEPAPPVPPQLPTPEPPVPEPPVPIPPAPPPPAPPVPRPPPVVNLVEPDQAGIVPPWARPPAFQVPDAPPPPLPPPPPPRPRPQVARRAPPGTFGNPMQFDLGGAPSRRSRQQRGLDLDFSAGKLGAEKPATVLRADKASPDWRAQFQAWINAHGYYPEAAAEAGQDGTVTLSFQVQTDGSVTGMRLAARSGSPFLDQGAISIFRNQKVPPLPPGTRDPPVDVTLTINYILTRPSR